MPAHLSGPNRMLALFAYWVDKVKKAGQLQAVEMVGWIKAGARWT